MNPEFATFVFTPGDDLDKRLEAIRRALESFNEPVIIDIHPVSKKRTLLQNRYYWSIVAECAREVGEDRIAMHEFFKQNFGSVISFELLGENYQFAKSTAEMNTKEFTDYVGSVKRWAADFLGLRLPDPIDYFIS